MSFYVIMYTSYKLLKWSSYLGLPCKFQTAIFSCIQGRYKTMKMATLTTVNWTWHYDRVHLIW